MEQESWLKMLTHFSRFEGRNNCKFTSWLFLVVRSVKNTVKKGEGREPSGDRRIATDDEMYSAEIERALQEQVQIDFNEDVYAVRLRDELLVSLSARDAEVLRFSLDDKSNKEISQLTGMPEGTVSSILCRTRALWWKTLMRGPQSSERSERKAKYAAGR